MPDPDISPRDHARMAGDDAPGALRARSAELPADLSRDLGALGAGRFRLTRQLGSGGTGIVYEALDLQREERVALKTLIYASAGTIYNLKKEFRTLADVAHPNLVSLYELFAEDNEWFFTMELVDGVSFVDYARPRREHPPAFGGHPAESREPAPAESREPRAESRDLNQPRLRSALRQLAEGVNALHQAGKVHRDLKPSNVLVNASGRVVVLDFGIASEIDPEAFQQTVEVVLAGTADYMAPEQTLGDSGTELSDWYAVGVMLYEALTGQLPYAGNAAAVIRAKQARDPEPADSVAPGLPVDLVEICHQLLARNPGERLGGTALLRRLGTVEAVSDFATAAPRHRLRPIVGREPHLAALAAAFATTRDGRAVSVYVHGPSGIGKSTVVDHFLGQLVDDGRAVVLAGRCYDRESMPYKALDGVVDSLTRYLRLLPADRIEPLLSRDALSVARLFPALHRAIDGAVLRQRGFEIPDPLELRRRAFAALREMLARITDRHPLVIHIDDFQWADADSITLLEDLMQPPGAPPLMLIVSFRSEEVERKPFLQALLSGAGNDASRELTVGSLPPDKARELARSLLRPAMPGAQRFVDAIVEESGGSPFLLEQLASHVVQSDDRGTLGTTLAEMLEARIAHLPEGTRRLLDVLAVAGKPVDFGVAHRAAGLRGDARALVSALRVAHLIRSSDTADRIELYHDRIREALAERLDANDMRRVHSQLVVALRASGGDDPEALFEHYLGAGDGERAGEQAVRAANRAASALAFDRAARFFRRALDLAALGPAERSQLNTSLGVALANAGRPAEAAAAFLKAAVGAAPTAALECRRRAAEQLLFGGLTDRGLDVIRELLQAVGFHMPAGPRGALVRLLVERTRARLRGLAWTERNADDIPDLDLLRLDVVWACAIGLSMVDYIAAAYFQTRYLLLAVDAGEPLRVARSLALEAGFSGAVGGPQRRRTERITLEAQALAERIGSPREVGLAAVAACVSACLLGDFRRAAQLGERAGRILRERCTGVMWELMTSETFRLSSLVYLGEIEEFVRWMPFRLQDAAERGSLFEMIELRTRQHFYWLALDQPERARDELSGALARWSHKEFYRPNFNGLIGHCQIDLYGGDGVAAWDRLERQWRALTRSMLLQIQLGRIESWHVRARCAIAVAAQTRNVSLLPEAERLARRIGRERMRWSDPFVPLIRAGVAAVRGDGERTALQLGAAAAGFDAADMKLYAAATRRRLGQVLGGDQGRQLIADADEFMRAQRIENPVRTTAVLAPGFGE